MKRGFLNLRAFYAREVFEDYGESYIGHLNKVVPQDQEEPYDRYYGRVAVGIAAACVATGFVWGFREDKGDSAMFSIWGMVGGFFFGGGVIPLAFAFPLVGVTVGAGVVAKGAAVTRHWYQRKRKD